jgi:hypothetical protein
VTPEDLLAGPRGRRLCLELRRCADLTEAAILKALQRSVDAAMYWQEPDDKDYALADSSAHTVLGRVAEALCESLHTTWWDSPIAADGQFLVAFDGQPPAPLTGIRERSTAEFAGRRSIAMATPPPHVDWRTCSGIWWSSPLVGSSVSTTRAMGELGPVALWLHEDSPGPVLADVWQVSASRTARVYEIATGADWLRLVTAYPLEVTNEKRGDWWRTTGRDGRWLMPDWLAVRDEFDAVHLSALAYLSCAGVALDCPDDAATLLAGWNPDTTFWLDDIVQLAGPATRWRRDRDEWIWRPADQ